MNFKFRSHNKINDFDKRLLSVLNLPEVQSYFMAYQIKSLKSNTEDMHLLCVNKSDDNKKGENLSDVYKKTGLVMTRSKSKSNRDNPTREIIHWDIDESGNTSSATTIIDPPSIAKKCPEKNWYRVWFHTHNSTISAQSIDDRFATQSLYGSNVGDVMCSVGLNGVSCHFPTSNPPAVAVNRWGNEFWDNIKNYDKKNGLLTPIKSIDADLNIVKKKEIESDIVLCTKIWEDNRLKFDCIGRNWEYGIKEFNIGKFDDVYFDGPTDSYGSVIMSMPRDYKYECIAIKTDFAEGGKLICR